jgi:cysteinyl-tRNA synthetase
MPSKLVLTNTLSGQKEVFQPINPPYVGIYQCGPTVYGEPHLGHARPAVAFDVLRRYLEWQGYKVRYVRNITDVGHLEQDADEGEDKIAKKARLEQLEPMEIAQRYTLSYQDAMSRLGVKSPSIEPRASGHVSEQIEMIKSILDKGLAYEVNGSVYFDIESYRKSGEYGILSGRNPEDQLAGTRDLDGQDEKRNPLDFALWKKAAPEHIMRWPSPWGLGFPGWHIECSAMSHKYLGPQFDIHTGGMDLLFPHHECELAQSTAAGHPHPVKYWVHNNMITINGQKMGKSLGNFINLSEFFSGSHPALTQVYSPMTIRLFMLQAHYRSPLDFSNEALQAAAKAYRKIMNARLILDHFDFSLLGEQSDPVQEEEVRLLFNEAYAGLDDDLNTAVCLAAVFGLIKKINALQNNQIPASSFGQGLFEELKDGFRQLTEDILGISNEKDLNPEPPIDLLMDIYKEAKLQKDYAKVDQIRARFKEMGLLIKDLKSGSHWAYEE